MEVRLAKTDEDIAACYAVMRELRTHIPQEAFVPEVREQMSRGYNLVYLVDEDAVVAVAGFRLSKNLAWGQHMYVEDLVTDSTRRSKGYGQRLLGWLRRLAQNKGCAQIHLDSGVQRFDAHRFYMREGLCIASYHFAAEL